MSLRRAAAFADDDDHPTATDAAQQLTSFHHGQRPAAQQEAENAAKRAVRLAEQRVIPALPDADLRARAASRRSQPTTSNRPHAQDPNENNKERIGDAPERVGLYTPAASAARSTLPEQRQRDDATPPPTDRSTTPSSPQADLDAIARQAVLTGSSSYSTTKQNDKAIQLDDTSNFRHDVLDRPEAPDAAAYASTPVEGFGAAMLRGMGWAPGQGAGRRRDGPEHAPENKRRPALLGLGAAPRLTQLLDDGHRKGGPRPSDKSAAAVRQQVRDYRPIARRDRSEVVQSNKTSRAATPTDSTTTDSRRSTSCRDDRLSSRENEDEDEDRSSIRSHRSRQDDRHRSRRYRSHHQDDHGHRSGHHRDEERSSRDRDHDQHRRSSRSHRGRGEEDKYHSRRSYRSHRDRDEADRRQRSKYDDRPRSQSPGSPYAMSL